jgi:hypothetical protein
MSDIPTKPPKRRALVWRLCRWAFLLVGAVTTFQAGFFLVMRLGFGQGIALPSLTEKVCFALVNVLAVVFLAWLFHRPFCWGVMRLVRKPDGQPTIIRRAVSGALSKQMVARYLFCLACGATLLAAFYAVENWRGQRAWEQCRRELEAKGEVLDWDAYIPPPVPDDQNVFKAPKMAEWFVRDYRSMWGPGIPSARSEAETPFRLSPRASEKRAPLLLAKLEVELPGAPPAAGMVDAVLRLDDPAAREQAAKLIDGVTGPRLEGARTDRLMARARDQIKPLRLVLQADKVPGVATLAQFLPGGPETRQNGVQRRSFRTIERAGTNGFHVMLEPWVYGAAEFLAVSQPAVPDLDTLRQALARPCARMDGDYAQPFARPIPNFVRLRTVAQLSSQRAECYLLLGQPEAAWHELALVHDVCRLLQVLAVPSGRGVSLLEVMIDTAISGLYVSIVQDGLRLQVWREPELAAIQGQLKNINLLPALRDALNAERAASRRALEATPRAELAKLYSAGNGREDLWDRLTDPRLLLIRFAPRGWLYQNMRAAAIANRLFGRSLDITNNQVLPQVADGSTNEPRLSTSRFVPYTLLSRAALPNVLKATHTLTRTQTMVNEAFVACGLERYHQAHGQYPDTLEALVPQFAAKLPHDLIGGQPLRYQRVGKDSFQLYSVGWNGRDDGGASKSATEEDWVWP